MSGNVDRKDSKEPDGAGSLNAFANDSACVGFNDLIEFGMDGVFRRFSHDRSWLRSATDRAGERTTKFNGCKST